MLILELGLALFFLTDFAAMVLRQTCLTVIAVELESPDTIVDTMMMLESDAKV